MPTREEMRSLAEEIVGSYADRVAGIAELRETVKMDLKGFRDYRIATGREIRADLARSVTERKHEVADMFKGFDAELIELSRARVAMSKEMRANLAESLADCKRSTGAMLEGFSQAHSTMSKEMRANLAKSLADCKRSTGAMLKSFSTELKEVRSELAGGRDEWQILTATMQAQRVGAAVEMGPTEVVAVPAEEMIPETTDLGGRVFEYLANHPDGTKMTGLEEEFGLARIQIAKIVKNLMDENKVEKRELFYFAI